MTFLRPLLALVLAAGLAAPLAAAAQTPLDPLDARDARRLDRMEQVLRELRSIVFQGRDTGRPVVVQPAETDYRLEELNRRVADLEQVLTRLNSQIETTNFELRQAKEANTALETQLRDLRDRTGNLEAFTGAPPLGESAGPVAGRLRFSARRFRPRPGADAGRRL
jgi:TolA-binding protein